MRKMRGKAVIPDSPERYCKSTEFIKSCFDLLDPYIKSIHGKDSIMEQAYTTIIHETMPGKGTLDYQKILVRNAYSKLTAHSVEDIAAFFVLPDLHAVSLRLAWDWCSHDGVADIGCGKLYQVRWQKISCDAIITYNSAFIIDKIKNFHKIHRSCHEAASAHGYAKRVFDHV